MATKPEYRARLFFAADLVGSTAFKSAIENQSYDSEKARPKWMSDFENFYRSFPEEVKRKYFDLKNGNETEEHFPRLWKIIGDEVILCCRTLSQKHAALCVESFLQCLEEYSRNLENNGKNLGLKGNMWVASFPAPNTSIPLIKDPDNHSDVTLSEELEVKIDLSPHLYDFLGKAIDTGFRTAKHSSATRCSLTVQLAHLLVCEYMNTRRGPGAIVFDGTEVLKGVNDGTPYPKISIPTDNHSVNSELFDLENEVRGKVAPQLRTLKNYLEKFMEVAQVEAIWLPKTSGRSKKRLTNLNLTFLSKTPIQS